MTQRAKAPLAPAAIQHQFQAALLQVLRQPRSAQAQLALYQSAQGLTHTLTHPAIQTFWQVASVFLETQALSLLPVHIKPQPLLVRLERQLQHHLKALENAQPPQPELVLLHELLIILARLDPRTPALKQLNFNWGLPNVARRSPAQASFAQQQLALRQSMAHLAYQHLSQLVHKLNQHSYVEQRLNTLGAHALRLLAALPLPALVDRLSQIQAPLAALATTPDLVQHQRVQAELNAIVHQLLEYRQTLSRPTETTTEPAQQPAPTLRGPTTTPSRPVVPAENPLQRVLLQDGKQSIKLVQQWLLTPANTEPLSALALAFSTISDASHALDQGVLSELSNALCTTFNGLQILPAERLKGLNLAALEAANKAFAQCLQHLETGALCTSQTPVLEALVKLQQSLEQNDEPPPWDNTPAPALINQPHAHTIPPWNEASPTPARNQTGSPQQVVRLPAQWLETYIQLAQTGRQERHQMQAQLTDLDYQLEQLEADGTALLAEFASHNGVGAASKTLMASLRSVLALSQSLHLSSQQSQAALRHQQQLQQHLQDQLEGWQEVPIGRLEYPLQQHIQQLETQTGRSIQLHLHDAEQTLDEHRLSAWQVPLELLIQHAVRHSFDAIATRVELGKPSALQLNLTLLITANETHLTFTDDGQGIPLAPLMTRARAQGLPAQVLQSTPTKLLELIFHERIAPSLVQNPLPGAGEELIAAAHHMQQLGGLLQLSSQVGVGTRYTLCLPNSALLAQH